MTDKPELPALDIDELYKDGRKDDDAVLVVDSRGGPEGEKYEFRLQFLRDIMRGNREVIFGEGRIVVGLCKVREPSKDKILYGVHLSKVIAEESITELSEFIPVDEQYKIGEPIFAMYFPTAQEAVNLANLLSKSDEYTVNLLEKTE